MTIVTGGIQTAMQPYLNCIRATLTAALCLTNFPSRLVERHNKPEIEARQTKESILRPIVVSRNANEKTLIETSINSVRVSIKVKQADDLERLLTKRFTDFLMHRADDFIILRRKPVEGYDLSFLITNFKCNCFPSQRLNEDLHSTSKTKHQVQCSFFLNVVVLKSTPIFKLFPCKDQSLLV
ncbi:MAG: putative ARP23 complex 20 kDa subunit, partial [Streblomastix strix]